MSGWIKGLFWFGIFFAAVYAGAQYGLPYFRYYRLKSDAADIVKFPINSADEVKAKIVEKAAEDGVPLDPANVSVQPDGSHFDAQANWSETVDLFGRYQKQLNFAFDVNAETGN
ncbi:MAG: hypothetical protein M0Z61_13485 [Nitrospiraceae bacterium]|nr:hypothetical protein [Nitrospiraceae bacterium]